MLPLFFSFLLALPADPVTVLEPDRVFDGVSSIHEGWIVVIQGEKILAGPKTSFKQPPYLWRCTLFTPIFWEQSMVFPRCLLLLVLGPRKIFLHFQ